MAAIVLIVISAVLTSAQDGSVDGREDFLRALDRLIPQQMSGIVVTYEAQGDKAGISSAGYDAVSGAWFAVNQNGCAGRSAAGRLYRADADDIELSESRAYFAELIGIAEDIPWCFLISMRTQPEMVVGAQLGEDSVWRVLYHAIDPAEVDENRVPWLLRVDDATGHVQSNVWTVSDESPVTEFDWSGTTVGLRTKSRASTDRVRTYLNDHAELTEFEPQRVFQRMKEYRIRIDQKLNALSSGYVQTDGGEWVVDEKNPPSTQPFRDPVTRRFRMPLIVGGGVIIAIGIVQLIRRGRAQ